MELGTRIRERRKERGLTQDELSRLSGVSKPYISQIETGKKGERIGHGVARALAAGLKVNISFFGSKSLREQTKADKYASME